MENWAPPFPANDTEKYALRQGTKYNQPLVLRNGITVKGAGTDEAGNKATILKLAPWVYQWPHYLSKNNPQSYHACVFVNQNHPQRKGNYNQHDKGIVISDLIVDGNGFDPMNRNMGRQYIQTHNEWQGLGGIDLTRAEDVTLKNLVIRYCRIDGLALGMQDDMAGPNEDFHGRGWVKDIKVENVVFAENGEWGTGITGSVLTGMSGWGARFLNCTWRDGNGGCDIEAGKPIPNYEIDVVFDGCKFLRHVSWGFEYGSKRQPTGRIKRLDFVTCTFSKNKPHLLFYGDPDGLNARFDGYQGKGVRFIGCWFLDGTAQVMACEAGLGEFSNCLFSGNGTGLVGLFNGQGSDFNLFGFDSPTSVLAWTFTGCVFAPPPRKVQLPDPMFAAKGDNVMALIAFGLKDKAGTFVAKQGGSVNLKVQKCQVVKSMVVDKGGNPASGVFIRTFVNTGRPSNDPKDPQRNFGNTNDFEWVLNDVQRLVFPWREWTKFKP